MKPKPKAIRCRVCLLTMADWHEPDEKGVRATVRLTPEPDGAFICNRCKDREKR